MNPHMNAGDLDNLGSSNSGLLQVRMYVCVCLFVLFVCMYVCLYVYMYVCMHGQFRFLKQWSSAGTHVCVLVRTHVCMHVCMHAYICVCVHIHIYIYIYILHVM